MGKLPSNCCVRRYLTKYKVLLLVTHKISKILLMKRLYKSEIECRGIQLELPWNPPLWGLAFTVLKVLCKQPKKKNQLIVLPTATIK